VVVAVSAAQDVVARTADQHGSTDEGRIATAVAAGAVGWLPKTSRFEDLVAATVRATEGRSLLDDAERTRLRAVAEARARETEGEGSRWQRLTRREREIVEHIVVGKRPAEIAAECVVSVATVRTQIKSILSKPEVRSQLEVAAFARRHGIGAPPR
jgi:DNA-binding NarL/FixJ family response regulator